MYILDRTSCFGNAQDRYVYCQWSYTCKVPR